MGKYFKRFESHSQYEQYIQSENYITPNISVCDSEREIHYNPLAITHEYVDLGLPSGTLWATDIIKNENGEPLYFAWGETQGYTQGQIGTAKNFTWNDYEFGTSDNLTKYNSTDGKTVLDSEDDAATANWGSNWKIPTNTQISELISTNNTNYIVSSLTEQNGVKGILFTSKVNGNTLFLPAMGFASSGQINYINSHGYCWSCKIYTSNKSYAIHFGGGDCQLSTFSRYSGYPICPVRANN